MREKRVSGERLCLSVPAVDQRCGRYDNRRSLFFCKDKNGLFGAVVEEPLKNIMQAIAKHFSSDPHADRDAMRILLEKSAGSSYENIIDRFVEMIEQLEADNPDAWLVLGLLCHRCRRQ